MENKDYSEIVSSKNAPYLNSLISQYSIADNYFALTHPSLPNYIAFLGGSTFGITSDCTDCYVNAKNLVDQLQNAHKTWKAYMESMPSSCFISNSGEYAQKHDPFIYFDDIRTNASRCGNIVPYSNLAKDFQSTTTIPDFFFITPNLCNDMHNCPVSTGDTWLANNVPAILKSPAFTKQNSLLVITGDEGETSSDNKIMTIFVGSAAKKSFVSHSKYTHYSLLKTIEDIWGLPSLTTNVSQSNNMFDMLQFSK
jgi:acid phosphatase